MKVTIEALPSYKMAYIRSTGAYGVENVRSMESLKAWAGEKGLMGEDSVILGIPQDDPAFIKAEDCRYDTCIVIPDGYEVESSLVKKGATTGGKSMIFEIEHTAEAVAQAWSRIFAEVEKQKCEIDYSRPIIERYAYKMVTAHRCEICVPLKE